MFASKPSCPSKNLWMSEISSSNALTPSTRSDTTGPSSLICTYDSFAPYAPGAAVLPLDFFASLLKRLFNEAASTLASLKADCKAAKPFNEILAISIIVSFLLEIRASRNWPLIHCLLV